VACRAVAGRGGAAGGAQDGQTPLHAAAYDGNLEVVKLLIESGANLRARSLVRTLYTPPPASPLRTL